MTFFERQEAARRRSRLLIWLFALAVAGTVAALDVLGCLVWMGWRIRHGLPVPGPFTFWGKISHVPTGVHVATSAIALLAIFAASAYKTLELRAGGGGAVARMMGGRGIGRGTTDPLERRLLNVVEEMALASGTRLPLVFVMDTQRGINAFSAGCDVSSAAITVTRGALESLTRDELQGVIAHEFSHIVNGDMALSTRIIGVLSGIVFIGAAGRFLMNATWRVRDARSFPISAVGFAVFAIGSVGLFCSRAIKSILSREREYLADAGGVQFTRHADPLAGALDQTRVSYSWVAHLHTENVSHLFFAQPDGYLTDLLFATHPPIDERIRRIAPHFTPADYRARRAPSVDADTASGTPRDFDALVEASVAASVPWRLTATQASALVGTVQAPHLEDARSALRSFSPELRVALDDANRAAGVVIALLLLCDERSSGDALAALRQAGFASLAQSAQDALPLIKGVEPDRHLALVDLALPTLRTKPQAERAALLKALDVVVAADRKVSLYGFAFVTFIGSQLQRSGAAQPSRYRSLAQLRDEAAILISLTAHAGCGEPATLERDFIRAFEAGTVESGLVGQVAAVRREDCTPEAASNALQRLQDLAPLEKARLVKGVFAAITADGVIRPVEVALIRMVGGVLDCPLPPLVVPDAAAAETRRSQPIATASA